MVYTTSPLYGDRSQLVTRKRLRDTHGDELLWQYEHDAAVDKGLVQNMRENTYSFAKLLHVLRAEAVKQMHAADRWRMHCAGTGMIILACRTMPKRGTRICI